VVSSDDEGALQVSARLVCLVSGSGTIAAALIEACADEAFGARVVALGADRSKLEAFDRADRAGVPTFSVRLKDFASRDEWDAALTTAVAAYDPDLVVLAGFMKLTGQAFLARFGGRVVNTHPALLPAFPGMHGARDALEYGVKVSGATVFVVDAGTDTGPVVAQRAVEIRDDDTEETLHERIKVVERSLVVDTVGRLVREGFQIIGRKVVMGR